MSHHEIDAHLLQKLVHSKRKAGEKSLREAAEEIGVSAPTLQRVENGQIPNTASLLQIVSWLQVSMEDLYRRTKARHGDAGTLAKIEVHLRADPNLDATAASAIAEAVQKLYAAYSNQPR